MGRAPPPPPRRSKILRFHEIFGKNWQNHRLALNLFQTSSSYSNDHHHQFAL